MCLHIFLIDFQFMGMAESSLSHKSQREVIDQQHLAQVIGVTLMRAQMRVILQASYNGHQRNATSFQHFMEVTSYVV